MEESKIFKKQDFLNVFQDISGPSSKILNEEEKLENGILKCVVYTYTTYDEDYGETTGPFKLTVFFVDNDLSFILDTSIE